MSAVFNEPLNKQMDMTTLRRKYESHLVHLTSDNRHKHKSTISTRTVAPIHASNPKELQWMSYAVCDIWTSANTLRYQSWCPERKKSLPDTYDIRMPLIITRYSIFTKPTKQDSDSNDNGDANEEFTEQQSH
jgi:hypothetical protein